MKKKDINKCKNLKNKRHSMTFTAITDLVIRKKPKAYLKTELSLPTLEAHITERQQ